MNQKQWRLGSQCWWWERALGVWCMWCSTSATPSAQGVRAKCHWTSPMPLIHRLPKGKELSSRNLLPNTLKLEKWVSPIALFLHAKFIWLMCNAPAKLLMSLMHSCPDLHWGMWVLFDSSIMFSNFYRLDVHIKTCVALANLQWRVNKTKIGLKLGVPLITRWKCMFVDFLTKYTGLPNRVNSWVWSC